MLLSVSKFCSYFTIGTGTETFSANLIEIIIIDALVTVSRGSSVGIATGYRLDDQGEGGSSSPGRVKNLHFSISSRPALGSTKPPIK
jgi:hypothetical protein